MEELKMSIDDLKQLIEEDDSVDTILGVDPEQIDDTPTANLWQSAIDAISELNSAIYNYE